VRRWRANTEMVVHETIDSETILIHMELGESEDPRPLGVFVRNVGVVSR
jgi:hypothetical protein